jgi:hypothetical protein
MSVLTVFLTFAFLNAFDAITTYANLRRPELRMYEKNKNLLAMMRKYGRGRATILVKTIGCVVEVSIVAAAFMLDSWAGLIAFWFVVVLNASLAIRNLIEGHKARKRLRP